MALALAEGNPWAVRYSWLLYVLLGVSAVSGVLVIFSTRWFRSLNTATERSEHSIVQNTHGASGHTIIATHGSIVSIQPGAGTGTPPSLSKPTTTQQILDRQNPAPLVFDGFRARESPYTFPVPLGTQYLSVVYVKNNQLSSGRPIHNVRAKIDYLHDGQPRFTVERVMWWEERYNGTGSGVHRTLSVDLEANESQCFPVFMRGDSLKYPQSAMDSESSCKDLGIGRWTAKIAVTSDFQQMPLNGEIEFTVLQEPGQPRLSIGCHPPLGATRLPSEGCNTTGSLL